MNYRQLRCRRGLSRTDRPVPGVAPAILWLQACGGGAKRSRLSSSGGPVSQRICVPTRQTATDMLMQLDHVRIIQRGQHRRLTTDISANRASASRSRLGYLIAPGCPAHHAGPAPHHRNRLRRAAPARCTPGNGPLGHVCLLAAVSRRVTRLLTTVSSRIGRACFRVAALGRGWCAAGGAW